MNGKLNSRKLWMTIIVFGFLLMAFFLLLFKGILTEGYFYAILGAFTANAGIYVEGNIRAKK